MATGVRHERRVAAILAPILLLAACGENGGRRERDAGGEQDADLGVALDSLFAELDDGVAGKACETDEECGGKNAKCSFGQGPVRSCTGLCDSDERCGEGGTCVEVARLGGQPVSFCQKVCADDSECDEKLQCSKAFNVYEVLVFISERLRWVDVSSEGGPKICQEKPLTVHMEEGFVGLACSDPAMCGGGNCIMAPPLPGGYCGGNCLADEDCGIEGGCLRDQGSVAFGLPGMCLLPCTSDSECRQSEGYGCLRLPFFDGSAPSFCINYQWLNDIFGVPPPPPAPDADAGEP